jgi:hypothetical protein
MRYNSAERQRITQAEDALWKILKFTEAIRWTPTIIKRAATA